MSNLKSCRSWCNECGCHSKMSNNKRFNMYNSFRAFFRRYENQKSVKSKIKIKHDRVSKRVKL